jgi:hypothetical protein
MNQQPLFKTTHDALTFAFAYSGQQYDRSAMARAMVGATPAGKGLSGVDGAGQAGMIRRKVASLGPVWEAILQVRYAPRMQPCCACGKDRLSDAFTGGVRVIQEAAVGAALSGQLSNRALRTAIVARAFGLEESLVQVAEECGVARNTASKHNGLIIAWLRGKKAHAGKPAVPGEEERAFAAIDELLCVGGIVGELIAA